VSARQPYPKDYATLIPVLIGIAEIFNPLSVLEYGAGQYSTPLFLNRDVFPRLASLLSCETSQEWIQHVQNIPTVGGDGRLTWWYDYRVNPDDRYSLVLVDSESEQGKIDLIKRCGLARKGVVVIHDTDHGPYAEAVRNSFKGFVTFDTYNPWTTVAWNGEELSELFVDRLLSIREKIERNGYTDPTDVAQWIKIFQEHQ
jgi:hypothetical protein